MYAGDVADLPADQRIWPPRYRQVLDLANIFVVPLISIVPALLYVKMRQLGGESLNAVWAQIEEGEQKQSAWQQRMRTRLSLHTPTSHRTTTG